MRPYRVIQWATGSVGRLAIRAIAEAPDLEIVGVWVHSASKIGKDAGELAGIDRLGVAATNDARALLALDADCVCYAPLLSDVDEICRILAAGKNVVTPTGYVFLKDPAVATRIDAACRAGGVSFHGSGIHPGFAGDRLPLVLSALSQRIDKITVIEESDFADIDESRAMVFDQLGFGMPAAEARRQPPALMGVMSTIFKESMQMIAAGLGFEIDGFATSHEPALATRDIDEAGGRILKDHVAGHHFEYKALRRGKPIIEFQTYWKMTNDIEPRWDYDAILRYTVLVEGRPSFRCVLEPFAGQDVPGLVWTAMNCVNAIPLVCAAEPGIRTPLDLPMITARPHAVRLP
ncbi:MAG: dihydrodipicolinate reductase [Deltaproteobacteria bacterium]|nr:dihydrodipicolinate reductase [Deltaproteobacteria bacterium]